MRAAGPLTLLALVALAGCASPRADAVVLTPPVARGFSPVTMGELQGRDGMVFPEISVADAYGRAGGFAAQCLEPKGWRRVDEAHGFKMVDAAGVDQLRITVARVSQSSAFGIDGAALDASLKEAVASAVQGRGGCDA